jgi:hypothetical protein
MLTINVPFSVIPWGGLGMADNLPYIATLRVMPHFFYALLNDSSRARNGSCGVNEIEARIIAVARDTMPAHPPFFLMHPVSWFQRKPQPTGVEWVRLGHPDPARPRKLIESFLPTRI